MQVENLRSYRTKYCLVGDNYIRECSKSSVLTVFKVKCVYYLLNQLISKDNRVLKACLKKYIN